jgi:hypothetical protein
MRAKPSWSEIIRAEPRLRRLYADVRAIKDDKSRPSFCANGAWYGYCDTPRPTLKQRMFYLVGFHAAKPELRTMAAYDVAYNKLYSALPDCRDCLCLGAGLYSR